MVEEVDDKDQFDSFYEFGLECEDYEVDMDMVDEESDDFVDEEEK